MKPLTLLFTCVAVLVATLPSHAQNPLSPERLVDGYFSQKTDQNLKMLQELAGFLKAKTKLETSESEFYGATNDMRRLKRMTDEKAKNFFDGEYCSECNRPSVQIESEEPETFAAHLVRVKGTPYRKDIVTIQQELAGDRRLLTGKQTQLQGLGSRITDEKQAFKQKRADFNGLTDQQDEDRVRKLGDVADRLADYYAKNPNADKKTLERFQKEIQAEQSRFAERARERRDGAQRVSDGIDIVKKADADAKSAATWIKIGGGVEMVAGAWKATLVGIEQFHKGYGAALGITTDIAGLAGEVIADHTWENMFKSGLRKAVSVGGKERSLITDKEGMNELGLKSLDNRTTAARNAKTDAKVLKSAGGVLKLVDGTSDGDALKTTDGALDILSTSKKLSGTVAKELLKGAG